MIPKPILFAFCVAILNAFHAHAAAPRPNIIVIASAPNLASQPFVVTIRFDSQGKDGVLVAQGGSGHGFTLFLKNGQLHFAIRRGNVLTTTAGIEVTPGLRTAKASFARGGAMTLVMDDRPPVTAQAAGLLEQMPVDGLDVGEDAGGLVGPYSEENGFTGRIDSVHIKLQ
jgi:hypothetical protein